MSTHRIYVIWDHPLFYEAVRLLLQHPDILWMGAASNSQEALAQIASLHPDTVLIEEVEDNTNLSRLMGILDTGAAVSSAGDMRIFFLNLENNELRIYHREQKTVAQAEDLLHLICEGKDHLSQ
jgi:DNA-binding NarL/FixJ family response regulator